MSENASGTIVPEKDSWRCKENGKLRSMLGCGFHFLSEKLMSYVKIVNRHELNVFHAPESSCRLDLGATKTLGCTGTWDRVHNGTQSVEVWSQGYDQVARLFSYAIRVKSKTLQGSLLKIGLTCTPFRAKPCIAFKVSGRRNCEMSQTPPVIQINTKLGQMSTGLVRRSAEPTNARPLVLSTVATMSAARSSVVVQKNPVASFSEHVVHTRSAANPVSVTGLPSTTKAWMNTDPSSPEKSRQEYSEDVMISAILTATAAIIGLLILFFTVKLVTSQSPAQRERAENDVESSSHSDHVVTCVEMNECRTLNAGSGED
ncbi:uncharacterized protein LOC5516350 isoform X2 [Nematostella vectensis]|uniref:uncharacterized protein LOC5516350 isoform X2 n=1 Tax=Nematostella vectensis TaxID=45351 RepID=UPI0020775CA8|nr:uncharacterized protein LOC5516350 isoform X2 [Nematostella vectensis]